MDNKKMKTSTIIQLKIEQSEADITFRIDDNNVLRLTKHGFVYNGQIVEDAGEARDLFIKTFSASNGA